MKRPVLQSLVLLLISLGFFINPLVVKNVEADYLKVNVPSEITENTFVEVGVEISAKPSSSYSIKGRLGPDLAHLTKGQTQDSGTGVWLSDSVSWDRFPKFQTDEDGHWVGKINVRAGQTATVGQNFFVIRIKNNIDGSTKDSEPYGVTLIEQKALPTIVVESKGEPILNEFLPSPVSGGEWVEIKNKGTGQIDLGGWFIDDEEGKSSPFEIPQNTIVEPNSFYVAYFSSAKLNDLTDSVRLLKPDNTLVEEYRYSRPVKGSSFAKDSAGVWFITENITPGTVNPEQPAQTQTVNSSQEKTKVLDASTSDTKTENSIETSLPNLKVSTESAKIATVSASFKGKENGKGLFGKLPFIAGAVLILGAIGLVGKNIYFAVRHKKGQSVVIQNEQ